MENIVNLVFLPRWKLLPERRSAARCAQKYREIHSAVCCYWFSRADSYGKSESVICGICLFVFYCVGLSEYQTVIVA